MKPSRQVSNKIFKISNTFRWFRNHFTNEILPNWMKSAVDPNGFFHPNLSRNWSRYGDPVGTLVSQSRLLYVFSNGYTVTKNSELVKIIRSGALFLLENFWDEHNGGFVWSCDHKGKIIDPTKDAYGHAFVILGLVYVYKATGEVRYLDKAMDVLHLLHTNFTDRYGGLVWRMSRDWKDRDENRSQNPMMHAFESMIALFPYIKDPIIRDDVKKRMKETVDLLFPVPTSDEYYELPEIYTKSWKPVPYNKSGYISVGHLFEWAFLLTEGLDIGLPDSYRMIADRLMKTGLILGYDSEKGYIKTWVDDRGNVLWDEVSWWEQSEALRALLCYIMRFERMDLVKYFEKILQFVKSRFIDDEFGGWYTGLNPDTTPRDLNKGSLWKLDYHQTGLCMEAIKNLNIL